MQREYPPVKKYDGGGSLHEYHGVQRLANSQQITLGEKTVKNPPTKPQPFEKRKRVPS